MKILTSKQIRSAEELANRGGLSYETMMETAGINFAKILYERQGSTGQKLALVCGKGNNGGDGFVAARWLAENTEYEITVILAMGEPKSGLSKSMLSKLKNTRVKILDYSQTPENAKDNIENVELIIDAIFGIGFQGEMKEDLKTLVKLINSSKAKIFSVDIPSGLYSDENILPSCHIKADHTITMLAAKPALFLKPTSEYCGEISVVDILVCEDILSQVGHAFAVTNKADISRDFPPRSYDSHKGSFGHVLSVCGSYQMPGAAVLAANTAVSCGAGLVTAAFPEPAYPAIAAKLTEPLLLPLKANKEGRISSSETGKILNAAEKASVVLLGCGLSVDEDTKKITRKLIKNLSCPIILDADGINIVSLDISMLKEAKGQILMTPHPGEMARLCGLSARQVNANRLELARDFAAKWQVTLLLKGANSVIADQQGNCYVNPTGNPLLSQGGSGDVLAGMIAAFVAQGLSPLRACVSAAYLHGYAADMEHEKSDVFGLLPTDLIKRIPFALSKILDA